mgnify:CR=1 FL=1
MRRAGRKKKPLTIQPIKCVVMLSSDEENDCIAAEKKENKQLKRIMEFADNNNLIPMKVFRRGIFGRRLRDEVFYKARQKVARDMFQCLMRWWLVSREYLRTGSIPKLNRWLMEWQDFYSLIRMICLWWHYIGKSISNIFGKSTIAYIRFRCRRLHHMIEL